MTLDGAAVTLDARANMVLAAAGTMTLRNAINSRLVLSSGLTLTSPLVTRINGATVQLNGACRPMSGVGHLVAGSGVGAVVGTITTGSPTVLGC